MKIQSKVAKTAGKYIKIINKNPEEFLFLAFFLISFFFAVALFGNIKSDINAIFEDGSASKKAPPIERKIKKVVGKYPIQKMTPYISQKDKRVAAFLVAIAKKESNWGLHSPKKGGKDCFNYWGYRGPENPTESGYSCFESPAHAVNVVGKRISNLIAKKIDTPREMLVWKCGNNSAARKSSGAAKWARDVSLYYDKVYN